MTDKTDMTKTINIDELSTELANYRLAFEIRLPLEDVVEVREDGKSYYKKEIEKLFNQHKEYYAEIIKAH